MAVPLPLRIPVIVVEIVMAGVVVELATVPAKPLALLTETDVTVPDPPPPPPVSGGLTPGPTSAPPTPI
jgi:hypothetical protein